MQSFSRLFSWLRTCVFRTNVLHLQVHLPSPAVHANKFQGRMNSWTLWERGRKKTMQQQRRFNCRVRVADRHALVPHWPRRYDSTREADI